MTDFTKIQNWRQRKLDSLSMIKTSILWVYLFVEGD